MSNSSTGSARDDNKSRKFDDDLREENKKTSSSSEAHRKLKNNAPSTKDLQPMQNSFAKAVDYRSHPLKNRCQ